VAKEYNAVQIGEAPMTPVQTAMTYITGEDRVLDMMIQFDTMMADCILTEYVWHRFSLRKLKRAFSKWQNTLQGKAWNALYLENHDHPRVINRYGSIRFWRESGTCLAASYIFQQGCPFIYQGQEIGMTNIHLPSIDMYEDIASRNAYHTFHKRESEEMRLRRIHISSRDSSRTPVQWDDSENAGFSEVKPWFYVNPNYKKVNAAAEEEDPNSILNFYRKCLALRKSTDTLIYGTYKEYYHLSSKIFEYERALDGDRYLIVCSYSKQHTGLRMPKFWRTAEKELVLCNYKKNGPELSLRPYETRVYHMLNPR
jgi:oligo-1,6-glucosidase